MNSVDADTYVAIGQLCAQVYTATNESARVEAQRSLGTVFPHFRGDSRTTSPVLDAPSPTSASIHDALAQCRMVLQHPSVSSASYTQLFVANYLHSILMRYAPAFTADTKSQWRAFKSLRL